MGFGWSWARYLRVLIVQFKQLQITSKVQINKSKYFHKLVTILTKVEDSIQPENWRLKVQKVLVQKIFGRKNALNEFY